MSSKEPWHLDKKVPLALILAIFIQTAGMFWWGGGLEAKVDRLEEDVKGNTELRIKVGKMETHLENIYKTLQRIEKKG